MARFSSRCENIGSSSIFVDDDVLCKPYTLIWNLVSGILENQHQHVQIVMIRILLYLYFTNTDTLRVDANAGHLIRAFTKNRD